MEKKIFALVLIFVAIFTTSLAADTATKEITKIERVRWSGLQLFGLKLFGSWATIPEGQVKFFGSNSPYFRLNEDDKTISG